MYEKALCSPSSLKERLTHTWDALFAKFGRFTEIQTKSIEPLLAGKNCLLISATSSGKTEAALAPLLERHIKNNKRSKKLSILYISPTRALVNDLNHRLQNAMEKLAVRMQIKTGDEPTLNLKKLPELLITTPESFDSLLVHNPRIAKDIHTVILDEIHLYDNTPRGDQVRILLNRLHKIKKFAKSQGDIESEEIQFCAMSATIHKPEEMALRYFQDPVIINVPGQRNFSVSLLPLFNQETFIRTLNELKDCRKVLCFCQKRIEAEQWGQKIKDKSIFGKQIFVHHSELDTKTRRDVENNFSRSPIAICFATSTLELGIDIGDIDLVILMGAPDSTASFLQRIGRANRRKTSITTLCFYQNESEEALFKVFIQRAREGITDNTEYFFRTSIIVQQLCSYIKQTRLGEINIEQTYELFFSTTNQPLINKQLYDEIIVHLVNKGFFTFSDRWTLKPSSIWHKLYEEHVIYSNISTSRTLDLIDNMTGRKLGEIKRAAKEGDIILFAGQTHRVVRRMLNKVIVQSEVHRESIDNLAVTSFYKALSLDVVKAMAKELAVFKDKEDTLIFPYLEKQNTYLISHYLGEVGAFILSELLEDNYRLIVLESDYTSLIVEGTVPLKINFNLEQVSSVINRGWKELEPFFDFGAYHKHLPLEARKTNVIDAINLKNYLNDINQLFN